MIPELVPKIRNMNYESILANIELPMLEERRRREDLIQQFKFAKKV